MIKRDSSTQLFEEAKKVLPGGVNSPVRAFRSVNGAPIYFEEGSGAYIKDADGNTYIDFCCSWGPLILGHADPRVLKKVSSVMSKGTSFGAPNKYETQLARLIVDNHPYIEKIRFVNSGTEAAMSAIRLARGVTGKNKIIKFEGCYHGHVDSLMVKAGSGLATLGASTSAGIPEAFALETIVLPLNDTSAVEAAVEKYGHDIACIAIEPIPANNGLLLQDKEFLLFLRTICTENNVLLFFDEVISGFRVAFAGASEYYGIEPDMVAFGKIIGGGFPVGAYAAKASVMDNVSPDGPVYQAGTLSGNPVAMAAGVAQLEVCLEEGFYESVSQKTDGFIQEIQNHSIEKGYPFSAFNIGSIFWMSFSGKGPITRADQITAHSADLFRVFFDALLERGIYIGPSGYEVGFVSAAHTTEDLSKAAKTIKDALDITFQP